MYIMVTELQFSSSIKEYQTNKENSFFKFSLRLFACIKIPIIFNIGRLIFNYARIFKELLNMLDNLNNLILVL